MDDKETKNADALGGVASSKGKTTPRRPNAEEFVTAWRDAISSSKNPLAKMRAMVKTGFVGEINAEVVSQIISTLQEHRDNACLAERLALSLAVQERFGKLRPLAERILATLRSHFEKAIEYDRQEFIGYRGPQAIEKWVSEHTPKSTPMERDLWFRRFVTCLLRDSDSKTTLTALIAATRGYPPRKGKAAKHEALLLRGLVAALIPPAIAAKKLQLIMAGANSLESQFQEALSREATIERQLHTRQNTIDDLEKKLSALEERLAQAHTDSLEKATKIAELENSIQDSSDRYALLDQHWRGVSEQQLAKQSGNFREKVQHELQEALLALDREQPNVEMALQRLRRIREIVEK